MTDGTRDALKAAALVLGSLAAVAILDRTPRGAGGGVVSAAASIKGELAVLIADARAKGLWLYTSYQGMWFSPDELGSANAEGKFLWGPVNWQLRDPKERLGELEREEAAVRAEVQRFRERMHRP